MSVRIQLPNERSGILEAARMEYNSVIHTSNKKKLLLHRYAITLLEAARLEYSYRPINN